MINLRLSQSKKRIYKMKDGLNHRAGFGGYWLLLVLVVMAALPLCGVWLAGKHLTDYLSFPPLTRYVVHPGFSWIVFTALLLVVLTIMIPFVVKVIFSSSPQKKLQHYPFPLWGWFSILLCVCAWIMAWTRFEWFAEYQIFTFSPLWFGYIGIINALTFRRSGRCLLLHQPHYMARLFLMSALFWWYFEYLNRFVQNWYYLEVDTLTPSQYVLFATLPFSTVLPAVLSTYELLKTYPKFSAGLNEYKIISLPVRKAAALPVLLLAGLGLLGIGIYPEYLYPLIWISPLIIIISIQHLTGKPTIFSPIEKGNWQRLFLLAISALICGFSWEMWNIFSYAKWEYSIPYVQRFHLFEMPILGYAGYLPFGLECGVVADLCKTRSR